MEQIFARHPGYEVDPSEQDDLWAELAAEVLSPEVPFDAHWRLFQRVYEKRRPEAGPPQVWRPDPDMSSGTNVGRAMRELGHGDYGAFHAWSAAHRDLFWADAVKRLGIRFHRAPQRTLDDSRGAEDVVWFPGAEMNIVESCFQAEPTAVAVLQGQEGQDGVEAVTYGELKAMVDRVTAGLRKAGFRAGDAIALYMPMNVECVAAYLGIIQAGCAAISIADSFAPAEVRMRLQIGQAAGIVTVDAFARGDKVFPLYDKVKEAEGPRAIVLHTAATGRRKRLREGDLWWDDLIALGKGGDAKPDRGDAYRVTNILFSSGTTGEPKAIPWTHLTPVKCAVDAYYHQDVQAGEVLAWPTNIGWMMGPWLIYAALVNKATMALYEGAPNGPGFCRFVQEADVKMLGLVPSLVRAWRSSGATEEADWSRVRVFSSTGEASNVEDYLWLMSEARYRAPVVEYCGGTEIGGGHITGTLVRPASPATFTTPALGLDLTVLDEEGRPVAPGGFGTLFLIPPSVGLSQSLLNRDHHEEYYADAPPGPDGQVLRRHGDAVAVLHGGFWRAQGRADDTMNLGGIKVSSLELERVMDADEAVYQTAAVAVPPEGGGADRLVVFVVPEGQAAPADLKARLQKRISAELNPLFRIHDVVPVDALPRTASNKIMRRELRAQYVAASPSP